MHKIGYVYGPTARLKIDAITDAATKVDAMAVAMYKFNTIQWYDLRFT